MKTIRHTALGLVIALATLAAAGCVSEPGSLSNAPSSPSPSAATSPTAVSKTVPVTLPVLDALFSDEAFKTKLKAQVELTDDQIAQLQKIAREEVARLRASNTETANNEEQSRQAEQTRDDAAEAIRGVIGAPKAEQLFTLAREFWVAGNGGLEPGKSTSEAPENTLTAGPNGVPKDTRVVVNIPAFRMDVFKGGLLVKSYKIGIGYPSFPLPTGLRKAETIIFNPTWTPPDEPWVAGMKNVSVGKAVAAGSKLNPLGPIKIPIGAPSLIHGGKSLAKIGTFASHGCVGLTNSQVQDFAKVLAEAAGGEITDAAIKSYFANRTKTRVVKLNHIVPVELRYETIVVEDGSLHIYRDVYDQDTNTEANLRAVLEKNGSKLEDLGEAERTQVLEAVNAMSRHPVKKVLPVKTANSNVNTAIAAASPGQANAANDAKKLPATTTAKPIGKNQKEVVIELATLRGKGYPAAMNLDNGTGKPVATVALVKDH
jgi:lipoprotein-anchoring transpeptidase ErfK/SrfK